MGQRLEHPTLSLGVCDTPEGGDELVVFFPSKLLLFNFCS